MNIVIKVNDDTVKKMIEYYKDKLREKTPPYAIFQAQEEDTIITLYQSKKCMFQGTTAYVDANMWKAIDGQENTNNTCTKDYYNVTSIGSDEVGTGDYFGPIVVTAAYVRKEELLRIFSQKKLSDISENMDLQIGYCRTCETVNYEKMYQAAKKMLTK